MVVFFCEPASSIFITTGDLKRSINFRRLGPGVQGLPNYTSVILGPQILKQIRGDPGASSHKQTGVFLWKKHVCNGLGKVNERKR